MRIAEGKGERDMQHVHKRDCSCDQCRWLAQLRFGQVLGLTTERVRLIAVANARDR